MQDSEYLGELGGLSAYRQLVLLDPRGPADPRRRRTPPPTAATGWSTTSRRCASILASTRSTCSRTVPGRTWRCCTRPGTRTASASSCSITPSTFAVGISATGEVQARDRTAPPRRALVRPGVRGSAGDRGRRRHRRQLDGDRAVLLRPMGCRGARSPGGPGRPPERRGRGRLRRRRRVRPGCHPRGSSPRSAAPVLLLAGEVDLNSIPERRGRARRPVPERRARRPARRQATSPGSTMPPGSSRRPQRS